MLEGRFCVCWVWLHLSPRQTRWKLVVKARTRLLRSDGLCDPRTCLSSSPGLKPTIKHLVICGWTYSHNSKFHKMLCQKIDKVHISNLSWICIASNQCWVRSFNNHGKLQFPFQLWKQKWVGSRYDLVYHVLIFQEYPTPKSKFT